jgi:uncharacterized protein YlbG (UPF0298 family)
MPKRITLGKKIRVSQINLGKQKFQRIPVVCDIIYGNVQTLKVIQYSMGLTTYTIIQAGINGMYKILYIPNLEKDFFSDENVNNLDYIKDLEVLRIKNSNTDFEEINLNRRNLVKKLIF